MDKFKIANTAYQISKKWAPRLTDELLALSKKSVSVVRPKFYGYDKATGATRKGSTAETFQATKAEDQVEAVKEAVRGGLHGAVHPRYSAIYRNTGITARQTRVNDELILNIKNSIEPKQVNRARKLSLAQHRGSFLEDLSAGKLQTENIKRNARHYEMNTGHIQAEAPELFEHAMLRQGWSPGRNGMGVLDSKNPILIRPKASAGNYNYQDISKDENLKFVQYMLHQGKKNKMSLEQVQKWFNDDWQEFIVGQVIANNKRRGVIWTREQAIKSLQMNGGMPRVSMKNGKMYLDQVVMSSDQTMGFAPVSLEIGKDYSIKAIVHDLWDNGAPGSPLWKMWTGNQDNLVLSHSKVFNLEPSIINLRKSEMWGKVRAKVKRTVKNPERAGQGKDIVEAAKLQHGGDHEAMSDELLARLESYLTYQVKNKGKSPLKALDELVVKLGSGDQRKVDKEWLAKVMQNDDMVAIDVDSMPLLLKAREKSAAYQKIKGKRKKKDLTGLPLRQKIEQSMKPKESEALKESITFHKKLAEQPLPDADVKAYIDRRIMPLVFGSGVAGSGYAIYKKSQE